MLSLMAAVILSGTIHNNDPHEYRLQFRPATGDVTSVPINATDTVEKTCSAYPCVVRIMYTDDRVKLFSADENLEIKDGQFKLDEGGGGGGGAPAAPAPAAKPAGKKRR